MVISGTPQLVGARTRTEVLRARGGVLLPSMFLLFSIHFSVSFVVHPLPLKVNFWGWLLGIASYTFPPTHTAAHGGRVFMEGRVESPTFWSRSETIRESIKELLGGFSTHPEARNHQNHNFAFLQVRMASHDSTNTIRSLPEVDICLGAGGGAPPPPPLSGMVWFQISALPSHTTPTSWLMRLAAIENRH